MNEKTDLIDELGELIAALQVPISMHVTGLHVVGPIFDRLHTRLIGFGYGTGPLYAEKIREELEAWAGLSIYREEAVDAASRVVFQDDPDDIDAPPRFDDEAEILGAVDQIIRGQDRRRTDRRHGERRDATI